jgi:hypothetical protein
MSFVRSSSSEQPAVCVLVAQADRRLATSLVWSLPAEHLNGFVVLGSADLGRLTRLPGCLGHIEADLETAGADVWDAVTRLAHGRRVVALGVDDAGCAFVSRAQEAGLAKAPAGPAGALELLGDKWRFHELCTRLGLPVPESLLFADKTQIPIESLLAQFGGRLVVKPADQNSGRGVLIITSAIEFRRRALDNGAYDFAPLIVQAFIEGEDLGVNLLAVDGRILHSAVQSLRPDGMHFLEHPEAMAAAAAMVRDQGYSGFANIDAIVRADGRLQFLEFNARPWGSIAKSTFCGLNFVRAGLQIALGQAVSEPAQIRSGFARRPLYFFLGLMARPWRWASVTRDQRRLIQGNFHLLLELLGARLAGRG